MKTIGIDIGTTTVGIVVMDHEAGKVLDSKTIANGSFIAGEEWERIQDADKLMEKAEGLLEEMLAKYPEAERIGLTGQMHGMIYLDAEGKALSPLYTWQDGRAALPEFDGKSVVNIIKETCGIPAATGYGLITHCYFQKKGQVPEGAVKICTIADYLGMKLTGRKTPLIHASNAASLGFYDSANFSFNAEALEKMGVDTAIIPEVVTDVAVLGEYKGRPVTVSLGDNQASFLGAVGMQENVWQVNVGTGGQICVLSNEYFETAGIEARPYIGRSYILCGAILCAGRAYAILEKFFRAYTSGAGLSEEEQYGALAKLVEGAAENAGGLIIDTRFSGTRVDPDLRGSITNINETNFTPENLILAWLTGIVNEYYEIYRPICEGTGIKAEHLVASGNGARKNPVLQALFSSMFDASLTLGKYNEEAAAGAALSTAYAAV